jgi:hypothetical protein
MVVAFVCTGCHSAVYDVQIVVDLGREGFWVVVKTGLWLLPQPANVSRR